MTNLVTEVEKAIEAAKRHEGECLIRHVENPNFDYVPVPLMIPELLTKHGPAILAAVKLAESCFVGRWGDSFDKRQLDAYRAALRTTNQQSGDGK